MDQGSKMYGPQVRSKYGANAGATPVRIKMQRNTQVSTLRVAKRLFKSLGDWAALKLVLFIQAVILLWRTGSTK
eukprot:3191815-Pyramimonas_sp.AAC.1